MRALQRADFVNTKDLMLTILSRLAQGFSKRLCLEFVRNIPTRELNSEILRLTKNADSHIDRSEFDRMGIGL
jgi:hypothetical protein